MKVSIHTTDFFCYKILAGNILSHHLFHFLFIQMRKEGKCSKSQRKLEAKFKLKSEFLNLSAFLFLLNYTLSISSY